MKTYIAVIFFGIVMYTVAQAPNAMSVCEQKKPQQGVDVGKFFQGTWYLTQRDKNSKDPVCRKFTAVYLGGVAKFRTAGKYLTSNGGSKFYNNGCTSESGVPKNPFTLNCMYYTSQDKPEETVFSKLVLTVVETDYNNALVYRCNTFQNKAIEGDLVLLQRNPQGGSGGSYGLEPCTNI